MTASEKIKAIASFFLRLNELNPDFAYVEFYNIKEVTGIAKMEAREICELLRKKGYIRYKYGPIMDTEPIFLPRGGFDATDYSDPKGLMFFFTTGDETPKVEIGEADFSKLEEIVASETLQADLAKELRPQIKYDPSTSKLASNGNEILLRSHNSKVIAEKIFSQPYGTQFTEDEISRDLDTTNEKGKVVQGADAGYQYIYNCINRVNQKIEELTGLKHLIQYKQGKIWIE